jgi:hypothetical protein
MLERFRYGKAEQATIKPLRMKKNSECRFADPSLSLAKPTSDTHSVFLGGENFVPEISSKKTNKRAHAWFD